MDPFELSDKVVELMKLNDKITKDYINIIIEKDLRIEELEHLYKTLFEKGQRY